MDKRFAKVVEDPRFKVIPKEERKLKLDNRFKTMLSNKHFQTKCISDKRGKKLSHEESENDFYKFFSIDDETDESNLNSPKEVETKEKKKEKKKKKRKKNKQIETQKNNNVSSVVDIKEEEAEEEAEILHDWGSDDDSVKRIENAETHRLAICNCDWDKIDATDIYVLLNSFKSKDGIVKSVKVYPSEFGKNAMREEDISGPKELRKKNPSNDKDDEDGTVNAKVEMERLRKYQLKRLKYYYAVVECDSAETANKIYEECDGIEFEMSSTRLDIRFIPDDVTFTDNPKSQCDSSFNLEHYEAVNFLNTALQQTKVRLTWDESDTKRLKATTKNFSAKELQDMDFEELIGSGSEEDEAENIGDVSETEQNTNIATANKNRIEKYKDLLQHLVDDMDEQDLNEELEEEEHIEWEDVESSDDEIKPAKQTNNNTKQKKTKKKNRLKEVENENNEEKNELELLLHEDDDEKHHFNLTQLLEREKNSKTAKKKLRKKRKAGHVATDDDFNVDLNDERFSKVFSSSLYNIDPSHPNFKKTAGTKAIMSELQQHRERDEISAKHPEKISTSTNQETDKLSALIHSVKSKTLLHEKHKKKKRKQ